MRQPTIITYIAAGRTYAKAAHAVRGGNRVVVVLAERGARRGRLNVFRAPRETAREYAHRVATAAKYVRLLPS